MPTKLHWFDKNSCALSEKRDTESPVSIKNFRLVK